MGRIGFLFIFIGNRIPCLISAKGMAITMLQTTHESYRGIDFP